MSTSPMLEERLAARTLELVEIPSESGAESAILEWIESLVLNEALSLVDAEDAVRFFLPERRRDVPLVVLAGHVDTVPARGISGTRRGGTVAGRGASDMKGALAVMLELAGQLGTESLAGDLDVGLLFFGREELPITRSALLPLFDRCPVVRETNLVVVMEPTANALELGCLGNLNVRVVARGTAAHSARPWLGDNAIHRGIKALGPLAGLSPLEVEVGGLVYREVVSVTTIAGGIAANVVPDLLEATVNLRYAPTRTPAEAEIHLRELLGDDGVELEVVGNAPAGPVSVENPLVDRLRRAGDLSVRPKQAWTPVAEFATVGVDAVNFGPGDPEYAHRDDERVEIAALARSFEVLRAFVTGRAIGQEG